MELIEQITLKVDHGTAKAGTVFVRGLHGVPDFPGYQEKMNDPKEWFWAKGSAKEDNAFLHESWIQHGEDITS